MQSESSTPEWFNRALAHPREEGFVETPDGIKLEYLRWRPEDKEENDLQPLLFVHGNGANAHWYAFIAPFFASSTYDVVSFSQSGCGRSDLRPDSYDAEVYAEEILAVFQSLRMLKRRKRPIVVAHSLGSMVTMRLALLHGELLDGVILADLRMDDRPDQELIKIREDMMNERRRHPNYRERPSRKVHSMDVSPASKYKLIPVQPCNSPFVVEYLANELAQILPDGEGWSWRGDCNSFRKLDMVKGAPLMSTRDVDLALAKVPIAVVYGSESFFLNFESMKRTIMGPLRERVPVVFVQNARHHLFLDEPLSFVGVIESFLAMWPSYRAKWQADSSRRPCSGSKQFFSASL